MKKSSKGLSAKDRFDNSVEHLKQYFLQAQSNVWSDSCVAKIVNDKFLQSNEDANDITGTAKQNVWESKSKLT